MYGRIQKYSAVFLAQKSCFLSFYKLHKLLHLLNMHPFALLWHLFFLSHKGLKSWVRILNGFNQIHLWGLVLRFLVRSKVWCCGMLEPTSFKTLMGEVWTTFVSGWLIYLGRKQTCLRNEAEPTVLSENSDDGSQNSLELGSPHQNLMDTTMDGQGFAMFGDYSLDLDAAGLAATRFKIEFYGLSLQLKSRSKHVLRSASGVLPESKLTAIMGPSGSGTNTVFLNAQHQRLWWKSKYSICWEKNLQFFCSPRTNTFCHISNHW